MINFSKKKILSCDSWKKHHILHLQDRVPQEDFVKKSGLRRILFDKSCLRRILFHLKYLACGACFSQEILFLINRECISFQVSYSVYQYISGKNDSNSNTEWCQRHNLYQTVITKVSNNKPFVKSNLLRYKLHNTISIPKQFIRNNVTKHSHYFVWKDTSERVARRCDDTVDRKRLNSVLHYLFWRELCKIEIKKMRSARFFETALCLVWINQLQRINSGPKILRSCFIHWKKRG